MKIIIATNNEGKVREFKTLLAPYGYEAVSLKDEGIKIEIEEDGETFEENAHIKAKAIYDLTHTPVIADDSGLEVEFLDGAPGVYSARYAGEGASDADRCAKVLSEMEGVAEPLRKSRFVCAVYFILDDETEYCFTGTLEGSIGQEPVGKNGFGYDPIFMLPDGRSVAELSEKEKNKISHRANALNQLIEVLKNII